jgi:hypothetical protein
VVRDTIEVGAFSWARIQRLNDADAVVRWQRCEAEALRPQEVFTQLFHAEDVGNLLGLLDREEVLKVHKHLVWVGRESRPG